VILVATNRILRILIRYANHYIGEVMPNQQWNSEKKYNGLLSLLEEDGTKQKGFLVCIRVKNVDCSQAVGQKSAHNEMLQVTI
jgi:hypothetical protein